MESLQSVLKKKEEHIRSKWKSLGPKNKVVKYE